MTPDCPSAAALLDPEAPDEPAPEPDEPDPDEPDPLPEWEEPDDDPEEPVPEEPEPDEPEPVPDEEPDPLPEPEPFEELAVEPDEPVPAPEPLPVLELPEFESFEPSDVLPELSDPAVAEALDEALGEAVAVDSPVEEPSVADSSVAEPSPLAFSPVAAEEVLEDVGTGVGVVLTLVDVPTRSRTTESVPLPFVTSMITAADAAAASSALAMMTTMAVRLRRTAARLCASMLSARRCCMRVTEGGNAVDASTTRGDALRPDAASEPARSVPPAITRGLLPSVPD